MSILDFQIKIFLMKFTCFNVEISNIVGQMFRYIVLTNRLFSSPSFFHGWLTISCFLESLSRIFSFLFFFYERSIIQPSWGNFYPPTTVIREILGQLLLDVPLWQLRAILWDDFLLKERLRRWYSCGKKIKERMRKRERELYAYWYIFRAYFEDKINNSTRIRARATCVRVSL